jgi:hypothetical protein
MRRGWQVRGTSRSSAGVEAIEAAGLEGAVADPDRPGTILDLVGDVAAVVWLLGSAAGEAEAIAAIHAPRLDRLLEALVDTPVRGFAYEAAGSVQSGSLRTGRETVERAGRTWRIPVATLDRDRDGAGWADYAAGTVGGLLGSV